jgi:hypothetical protein
MATKLTTEQLRSRMFQLITESSHGWNKRTLVKATGASSREVKSALTHLVNNKKIYKENGNYNKFGITKPSISKVDIEDTKSLKSLTEIETAVSSKKEEKQIQHVNCGVTQAVRELFSALNTNESLTLKLIYEYLDYTYTYAQVTGAVKTLCMQGDVLRIKTGIYGRMNSELQTDMTKKLVIKEKQPMSEVTATAARIEKQIKEKEVIAREALSLARTFVKLKLGLKSFNGDFSLILLLGPNVIKQKEWKFSSHYELAWSYDLRRIRIFPSSAGQPLKDGDGQACLVFPLPEKTGYQFPKPIAEKEIFIPMKDVSLEGQDIKISLLNVTGINYV